MNHRLIFPHLRAKQPTVDHLLGRETLVAALAIDRLQKTERKGREGAQAIVVNNLLARHFFCLLRIDGLNATGGDSG